MNETIGIEIPAHVPAELVRDVDMYNDPRLIDDPDALMRDMASNYPPVFFTPRNGGHWVVVGDPAVREALRDHSLFGSSMLNIPKSHTDEFHQMFVPIQLDPPAHTPMRALLNPMFSPRAIAKLETAIRALSAELVAAVSGQGECEFIKAIALPLPVRIFMRSMGLPEDRYEEFAGWVHNMITGETQEIRDTASMRSIAYLHEVVAAHEPDPEGDWVSQILALTAADGKPLDRDAVVWPICNLLFVGGLDTVKNALAHFVRTMAVRPDLQQRISSDPTVIPRAVEEVLRIRAFVNPPRVIRKNENFFGAPVREGDMALIYIVTGALSPQDIGDPGSVDLDSPPESHIAFGAGPHRCLGSVLARLELRILAEEWFAAIPRFRIKPDPIVFRPGLTTSIEELHLSWDRPAARKSERAE